MFSTSFKSPLRYVVVCIANFGEVTLCDAVIDTGARYTCFQANLINPRLQEKDLLQNDCRNLGGFVDGKNQAYQVKFYSYPLRQFTIGNIDMGERVVWVTFDNRISDNVLGMDILQDIDFLQFRNTDKICFFSSKRELLDYVIKNI